MTPNERKAAMDVFLAMPPTAEREALRHAIESSDQLEATTKRHAETALALGRATELHSSTTARLEALREAQAASADEVRALLVQLNVVGENGSVLPA